MAIYYVPDESGWQDNGVLGSHAQLRLKLETSYDRAANRSTLTVTVQCRAPEFGGYFYLMDNASLRLNGGSVYSGGGSGTEAVPAYVRFNFSEDWRDLTDDPTGEALSWTTSIEHDQSGRAEAELALSARFYGPEGFYMTFYNRAGTQVLQETRQFTLTLLAGEGSAIAVRRGEAILGPGAALYYGDCLEVLAVAQRGYKILRQTINGADFANGSGYTVTGDVTIVTETGYGGYTLTISAGEGSAVTVLRGGSSIPGGTVLYDGDTLKISFSALPGYRLDVHTVNGSNFTSGDSLRVAGDVSVVCTAVRLTPVFFDTGSQLRHCRVMLDTGSRIVPVRVFLDRGDRYTEVGV